MLFGLRPCIALCITMIDPCSTNTYPISYKLRSILVMSTEYFRTRIFITSTRWVLEYSRPLTSIFFQRKLRQTFFNNISIFFTWSRWADVHNRLLSILNFSGNHISNLRKTKNVLLSNINIFFKFYCQKSTSVAQQAKCSMLKSHRVHCLLGDFINWRIIQY